MSVRKQTPSDFLKQIIGRPVVVKLNSGVDYRGEETVIICGWSKWNFIVITYTMEWNGVSPGPWVQNDDIEHTNPKEQWSGARK